MSLQDAVGWAGMVFFRPQWDVRGEGLHIGYGWEKGNLICVLKYKISL